ncbi:MAG TPA: amidase family protein [Polyangiaceae bacterium]|nr:amidase family protein [Polyangiaceae bacterium]
MTSLSELARLDAIAQAELCRQGEVSAAELWAACQARIAALNPLLGAVIELGREPPAVPPHGPLSGVPFLMKDASPWPGLRWSLGARLFAQRVTQQQTDYGKRLVEAGLVCAGKTALSEFGLLASTETLLEGATLNPWDLSRSPMGSSGGSAAAVAAGLVPLAHANDGGGSIRVPASACGLFGFKPSRGRTVVANRSGSDFADMTSEHCVSRSVRDSALFLALTEDHTQGDSVGFVRDTIPGSLRVGAWTKTLSGEEPSSEVRRAHEGAIALLRDLGHHVEEVEGPVLDFERLGEAFYLVAGAAVANVIETIDRTRREPVQRAELEPFTWSLVGLLEERGPDALSGARATIAAAVATYREFTRPFEVVLTPVSADEPAPLGWLSPLLPRDVLLARTRRALGYTPIQNIAGCPAMSVPLFSSSAGLPLGAHLAAARGHDARLLALAYQLEQARPWRERWPPVSIVALDL